MGERVSSDVVVGADAETILDVINDLDAYPDWAEGVREVEVLESDDEGRAKRARFVVDAKVFEARYTLEYEHGDGRVSWRLVEGDRINQLDGEYVLTPEGDGTRLRYTLEVGLNMSLPGFLKKRAAKTILATGLNGVKARAEQAG